MEPDIYEIAITLLPDIGDITVKKLIAYCGSAEAVFKSKRHQLIRIHGLGPKMVNSITNSAVIHRAEKELEFIFKKNITALFYTHSNYPEKLKHCIDGPAMIFYKGIAPLNQKRVVSIVGTRKPTNYGLQCCDKLIKHLQTYNICVISGLAYGIDSRAHQRAVELEIPTIGVLAHGLDTIYPWANKMLAQQMLENGGLLTDYVSGTNPDRQNFPSRNRIVAGMSDAVVVVESGERGGALITADIANSYNRDVFAFPGKITDSMSKGSNALIRNHKAAILIDGDQLAKMMGWDDKVVNKAERIQKEIFINLSDDEERIINLLRQNGETGIDLISLKCGISISRTASIILEMEFKGLITALPGKQYRTLY